MSEEEKEAIEMLKEVRDDNINGYDLFCDYEKIQIDMILNLIEKQQKEIDELKEENDILQTNYEILQGEMDRIGISTLGLEAGNSTDDVIDEIEKLQKELEQEKEKREIAEENDKVLSLDLLDALKELGLPEETIIADELVLEINKRYISKDKIRAKIEEYKHKDFIKLQVCYTHDDIAIKIAEVLEELLEE